jgi:hypothetical protein
MCTWRCLRPIQGTQYINREVIWMFTESRPVNWFYSSNIRHGGSNLILNILQISALTAPVKMSGQQGEEFIAPNCLPQLDTIV